MGLSRSNSPSCKQPHTVVTVFIKNYSCGLTKMTHQPSVPKHWGGGKKEGWLSQKLLAATHIMFDLQLWTLLPPCKGLSRPGLLTPTLLWSFGLTGAMTAAGMFDLEDSYLLVLFYLGFACVGFFAFRFMSGKCLYSELSTLLAKFLVDFWRKSFASYFWLGFISDSRSAVPCHAIEMTFCHVLAKAVSVLL